MSKKPDNIVFNEDTNTYDAYLKPYATNLSSPVIKITDTISWKKQNIYKANNQFKAEYEELKKEYQSLMNKYQYNELVYNARFSFEPIVGKTYHLYRKIGEDLFLSILAPHECNFNFVGSFILNSDKIWQKIA
ncbi:DUF2452 domain-containing protein [Tenacibaculum sp. nBUS_03]|uniref:DUF2452 domain-containing protein n=1 Tax=Tenacibaculum sp. nBUS_03 TaxID=3395320 RepID=UPI003EB8B29B